MNKKMRLTLVVGIIVGLMLTLGVQAATTPIKLILNGKSITTKTVGKATMVDINDVASALGSKVVTSGSNKTIAVKLGNAELMRDTTIVYNGSDSVFREDIKLTAPVKYNNKVYVPIDFLQKTGLTPVNYTNNGKKIVLGITGEKINLSSKVTYNGGGGMMDWAGNFINDDFLSIKPLPCKCIGYQTKDKDELFSIWGDDTHHWSGVLQLTEGYSQFTDGIITTISGLDKKYKIVEFDISIEATKSGAHDLAIIGNTTPDILDTIEVPEVSKVIKHIKIDVTGQNEIFISHSRKKLDINDLGKGGKIVIGDPVAY